MVFNLIHNMVMTMKNHLSSILGKTTKWMTDYYQDFKKDKNPYILVVGLYIDAVQENHFRNLHQSNKCIYAYIFLFWALILQVYVNM